MNSIEKLLVCMLFGIVVFSIGCKKDENCSSNYDYRDEIEAEETASANAHAEFVGNPSTTTCESYESALTIYIAAAKNQRPCAIENNQDADLNSEISFAEEDLDALDCSNIISGCNYIVEVQNEVNALSEAATAYGNDPTNPVKCQAWKDAYQNYLNALEEHIECAALSGQQAELQSAIDQAQASLNSIQC